MVERRPLVLSSGVIRELPTGDTLPGSTGGGSTFLPAPDRLRKVGTTLSARLAGPNIYDLVLSDKTNTVQRLSTAEVRRRLDAAKAMGANCVRTHAWISIGKTDSLMPTLNNYNEAAFVALDVVVAEARSRGLWLWAVAADRFNYFHGGAVTFAQLVLGSTNQSDDYYRSQFYNTTSVINAYKTYLTTVFTRTNTVTGVRYVDDPTIGVIETINEGYDAPASWTTTMLAHLRSIAPNTLLADGTNACSGRFPNGTNSTGAQDGANSLTQDCDIVGTHFYDVTTRNANWLDRASVMATAAGKVYVVGEWGWTETQNGSQTPPGASTTRVGFAGRMEANNSVQGAFWWSLLTDPAGATHDDGYQLFVPPSTAEQVAAYDDLSIHHDRMRSREGETPITSPVWAAYSDTFDGTGPLDPSKWIVYRTLTAGSATKTSNQAVLVTGSGTDRGTVTLKSNAPNRADVRRTISVIPTATAENAYYRVGVRGQGVGAAVDGGDGYVAEVDGNYGYINLKVRYLGVDTVLMTGSAMTGWTAGVAYKIELQAVGAMLELRWWLASGTRPAAPQFYGQDTRVPQAGATSITLNAGSATTSITWKLDDYIPVEMTNDGTLPIPVDVALTEYDGSAQPPTPLTGVTLAARRRGRVLPIVLGPRGHDVTLQAHLGTNKMVRWSPVYGAAAVTSDGLTASVTSNGGTAATAITPAATNVLTQCARVRLTSTATAGTGADMRGSVLSYFLSSTANMGGFDLKFRFGFNAAPATGTRCFVGMAPTNAAIIAGADPSALLNMVGIGWNAADTPGFYLMTNDGSGAATKTAIAGYGSITVGEQYELHLYVAPGANTYIDWALRAIASGTLTQGSITADLPATSTLMTPHCAIANGALTAAYSVDMVSMTCETDN